MENKIKFSVIIVSYKKLDILIDCLDSIRKYNDIKDGLEVIVVDNSPEDNIVSYIKRYYEWVKVISNENKGFGQANNVGAKLAKGKFLLFLNPDTILVEPVFDYAIEKFNNNKTLGAFGVKLIDKNGKKNMSYYWIDRERFIDNISMKILHKMDKYIDGKMCVIGADIFIRNELFKSIGGFDENIFMYNEEPDLFRRLKKANYKSGFFHDKEIIHLEGATSRNVNLELSLQRAMESKLYYCRKYNLNFEKYIKNQYKVTKIKMILYRFINMEKYLYQEKMNLFFKEYYNKFI